MKNSKIKITGISLLDYFAGQALMGILAGDKRGMEAWTFQDQAKAAFNAAEEMMAERNRDSLD